MNTRERGLMNRVYDCLVEMGSLMPPNPTNITERAWKMRRALEDLVLGKKGADGN